MNRKTQSGYTFIEILIASVIFLSVITIATIGFAQIIKYRTTINNKLDVNQVTRSLTETINREIRDSANLKIKVATTTIESSNVLLLKTNTATNIDQLICADDNISNSCYNAITLNYNAPTYLLIAQKTSDTLALVKVYKFKSKGIETNGGVLYTQYEGIPITANTVTLPVTILTTLKVDTNLKTLIDPAKALVGFKGILHYDNKPGNNIAGISPRLEYDLTVANAKYLNSATKEYEKSILTIHSAATARKYDNRQ